LPPDVPALTGCSGGGPLYGLILPRSASGFNGCSGKIHAPISAKTAKYRQCPRALPPRGAAAY